MAVQKRKVKLAAGGGDVEIILTARNALPLKGVLSNLRGQVIEPLSDDDPSVVRWVLPIEDTSGCVFYGVVTPPGMVLGGPKYDRVILQDGEPVAGLPNPYKTATRKLNPGEWVGTPEALRFIKK